MKTYKCLGGPFNGEEYGFEVSFPNCTIELLDNSNLRTGYHKYIFYEDVWYNGEIYDEAFVHDQLVVQKRRSTMFFGGTKDFYVVWEEKQSDFKNYGEMFCNVSYDETQTLKGIFDQRTEDMNEATKRMIQDTMDKAIGTLITKTIYGENSMSMPNIKSFPEIEDKKFKPYEVVIQVNTEGEHIFVKNALKYGSMSQPGTLRDALKKKVEERD